MQENRGLKNRIAISNAIDKELYSRLKSYSEETSPPNLQEILAESFSAITSQSSDKMLSAIVIGRTIYHISIILALL
jgi:hypothetical protein